MCSCYIWTVGWSNVLKIRTRITDARCLDRKNHGLEIERDKSCKDSTTKNSPNYLATYPDDLPKSAKKFGILLKKNILIGRPTPCIHILGCVKLQSRKRKSNLTYLGYWNRSVVQHWKLLPLLRHFLTRLRACSCWIPRSVVPRQLLWLQALWNM